LPGGNPGNHQPPGPFRELYRLVTYKIHQIQLLATGAEDPEKWARLERSIDREQHYAATITGPALDPGDDPLDAPHKTPEKTAQSLDPYEQALWSYYRLLEQVLLGRLDQMRLDVKTHILTRQIQKNITLKRQ